MPSFLIFSILAFLLSMPAHAQMNHEARDELFSRVEQMCKDADAELTRLFSFEGEANALGVIKLVGADISGSVTVEQYENIEQRLGDMRTNSTICQFEAVVLLLPIFSDKQGSYEQNHADQELATYKLEGDWS